VNSLFIQTCLLVRLSSGILLLTSNREKAALPNRVSSSYLLLIDSLFYSIARSVEQ
jgi:hypothetical protein